jgi:hypothetical protein
MQTGGRKVIAAGQSQRIKKIAAIVTMNSAQPKPIGGR